MHEALGRLTAVFVKLASVALSQGWIGRAKVAHQAVLIVRRKASVTTPLHACVQGAVERLSRSDRHVTLRFGSTEIGIIFSISGSKKHKSCQGLNTINEAVLLRACLSPQPPSKEPSAFPSPGMGSQIFDLFFWCLR